MSYRVVGKLGGKKYKSKPFATEKQAIRFGYKKTYRKDGNTKRTGKSLLNIWHVEKV